jgi:isopentenyldiphosphate isomerase
MCCTRQRQLFAVSVRSRASAFQILEVTMNSAAPISQLAQPSELLNAYDATGGFVKVEERERLLEEIREHSYRTGDAQFAVESVYLMLCNSAGNLYVVRRGDKPENPRLWDKTVGGHVSAGESHATTVCREAMEEIGAQVILTDFVNYPHDVRRLDTVKFAVVRPIDFAPWLRSVRVVKSGNPWIKRHRSMIYAGRFDGIPQFRDGEAIEYSLWTKEDLLKSIQQHPALYTHDIQVLLENYAVYFW